MLAIATIKSIFCLLEVARIMLIHKKCYKPIVTNAKGMTIVEVLVAAGLVSIVSLGIATMMQNMFIEQKRIALFATLNELKTRITSNITDPNSWAKTMAANADMSCLTGNTTCTAIYTPSGTPKKIILKDGAGNTAFDLLDWASTGSNGFTESGGSCSTFSATTGAGSDACPISYRLVFNMWCAGAAATCTNPQLKITGRLIYNPSTTGVLNRFRKLIAVGNLNSTAEATPSNDAKYDIHVLRTAVQVNRTFKLVMQKAASATTNDGNANHCVSDGVGTCSTAALTLHPLSWKLIDDTAGILATPTSAATNQNISFNSNFAGPYSCTISVPAFATQGFTAEFYNSTDNVSIAKATTTAGLWAQSLAVIETKFVAASGKNYQLRVQCQAIPPVGGNGYDPRNCSLGMHTQPYDSGPADIVTMNCFKIDTIY